MEFRTLSQNQINALKENESQLLQEVEDLANQVEREKNEAIRYRVLRDKYRQDAREKDNIIATLRAQVPTSRQRFAPVYDDSDPEDHAPGRRTGYGATHDRRLTPGGISNQSGRSQQIEGSGMNKRYPDVTDFHGTHDRETWDSWRLHLDSKFRQSAILFPTEAEKMDYVRDHCKSTAFKIIKARADPKHPDPYQTADEMINTLDNMFGEFNQEYKASNELRNPKFAMGAQDPKETFEEFYARYSSTVALLNHNDRQMMTDLQALLSSRLKYKVADGHVPRTFKELVERIRQCELQLRMADDSTPQRGERGSRPGRGRQNSGSRTGANAGGSSGNNESSRGNNSTRGGRGGFRHAPHIYARLMQEKRCLKCLQKGHVDKDANAPCKDSPRPNKEQMDAILASCGIEAEEEDGSDESQEN